MQQLLYKNIFRLVSHYKLHAMVSVSHSSQ